MRLVKGISRIFFLAAILFWASTCGAIADSYDKTVTTDIVIDGQKYTNTTYFSWNKEFIVPEGGINWDGSDEFIAVDFFTDEDLEETPSSDTYGQYYVKNQIAFTAVDGKNFDYFEQLAAQYGCRIVGYLAPTEVYIFESVDDKNYEEMQELVSCIRSDPKVLSETTLLRYPYEIENKLKYPNDPWGGATWDEANPTGYNWNVEAINAPTAWTYSDRMNKMKVGVIDFAFYPEHPDLHFSSVLYNEESMAYAEALFEQKKLFELGGSDVFFSTYLDELYDLFHGTHVAGTFAAVSNNNLGITGVFPNGEIVGISNYFTKEPYNISQDIVEYVQEYSPSTDDLIEKYYFLLMRKNGVQIINRSQGWSEKYQIQLSSDFEAACQEYTVDRGWGIFFDRLIHELNYDFLISYSAGNEAMDGKVGFIYQVVQNDYLKERLITVGAYGQDLFKQNKWADFSNYGQCVDVLAPGVNIYSTFLNPLSGDYDYGDRISVFNPLMWLASWSGTSQAAPHVAGTAAMIWSLAPDTLTGPQVKRILLQNANYTDALTSGHSDDKVNGVPRRYPLLDAGKAVTATVEYLGLVAPEPTNTPTPTPTSTPTTAPVVTATPTPSPVVTATPTATATATPTPTPDYNIGHIRFVAEYEGRTDLNSVQYKLYHVENDYYPHRGASTSLEVKIPTSLLPAGNYILTLFKDGYGYETAVVEFELPESNASVDLGTIILRKTSSTPTTAPSDGLSCTLSVSVDDYMTTYTLQCNNVQGEIVNFDVSVSNKNILLLDTAQGLVYDSTIITDDQIIFQLDDELINGAIMTVSATDSSGQTFSGSMYLTIAMDGSYQVPSED